MFITLTKCMPTSLPLHPTVVFWKNRSHLTRQPHSRSLTCSPLKNSGWKTIFSFWVPVTFQGLSLLGGYAVYESLDYPKSQDILTSKLTSRNRWWFFSGWNIVTTTPLKFNMEPENDGFQNFRGVSWFSWYDLKETRTSKSVCVCVCKYKYTVSHAFCMSIYIHLLYATVYLYCFHWSICPSTSDGYPMCTQKLHKHVFQIQRLKIR